MFLGSWEDEINPGVSGTVREFTSPQNDQVVTEVSQQISSQLKRRNIFSELSFPKAIPSCVLGVFAFVFP